ncbi:hypothetical protein MJO28_000215 [Puccinia striiformis f. sp. tritici]|uniref:Uncharacterized protein n=1 Tax=Puccinia striiformis f. sp. tritici TaxID=168172 RepID=A0ACC0EYC0_9BASI|nr:hypothetical protein MJO28_000215 [Puccinia striiformis f. sp. tritici]
MPSLGSREPPVEYDTVKLGAFLKNGTNERVITSDDIHILTGWSYNTLLGYNCGIKKFLAWKNVTGSQEFTLPITTKDIELFCLWAGKKHHRINSHNITARTIRKYLSGFKAWHDFHGKTYPALENNRLNLALKASSKVDARGTKMPEKPPIMLNHMVWLANTLVTGSDKDKAILDLAIVAFWGMARMAEITYNVSEGPLDPESSVLTSDVTSLSTRIGTNMYLTVRNVKTAEPGSPQKLVVHSQNNMLCPVQAITRRLIEAKGSKTSLFGYYERGVRQHITRSMAVNKIQSVLRSGGFDGLLGHSFRVGGASLRKALGVTETDICILGRWNSKCYKIYLRPYSVRELEDAQAIIRELNDMWEED